MFLFYDHCVHSDKVKSQVEIFYFMIVLYIM